MALTPSQKVLGRLAGVIGTLQGLAWAGMSLACIIIYYGDIQVEVNNVNNFVAFVNMDLYFYYLDRNATLLDSSRVIRPSDFIVLMWIYFFASVGWLTTSVDLFISVHFNRTRQSKLMILWGTGTSFISLLDLVVTSLLLRDFVNCPPTRMVPDFLICQTAVGIAMTLAARGFMLWLINVVVALAQIVTGIKIITHNKLRAVVHDVTIPRAKLPPSQTNSIDYRPKYPFPIGNQTSSTPPYNPSINEYPSFMKNENKFTY